MGRNIVKVRRVGKTLVVTLTQNLLSEVPLNEGDRVLMEPLPPRRIIISKEETKMPSTRRLELELEILEKKRTALESQAEFAMAQRSLSMPVDTNVDDEGIFELTLKQLGRDHDHIDVEISEKKLALFEAQGA